MKAFIYFNSKSKGLNYNGEGSYELLTEDNKCIRGRYCSSREFANYYLTEWILNELKENNISEVYSNEKLVWKDNEVTNNTENSFYKANTDYENKYCNY